MSNTPTPTSSNQSMSLVNWGLLILLSVLWGGSFFFNGVAVQEMPVLSIVFGRVGIAALALFVFLKIRGIRFPLKGSIIGAFLLMGFLNNLVPFSLIVAGQNYIGSGLASILNATTPLFAAVIAHVATQEASERLSARRIIGILSGVIGVSIMMAPDIGETGFSGDSILGQLAVLGASLSYGVAVVYGRRFGKMGISPVVTATGQVAGTTVLMAPLVLFIDKPWEFIGEVSGNTLIAVVALAVFSTAVAYILYFQLIKSAGATNASLVTLIIPASAVLLGVLFLDENISLHAMAGMGCIAAGLLVIDGRILNLFKQKQPGKMPG